MKGMKRMKSKAILLLAIFLLAGIVSCNKKKEVVDPVFEFVSFIGNSSVNVNEFTNSTVPYPLVVQLWVFKPYSEDITLTLAITGSNAVQGIDFTVTPSDALKIKAGSLTSDTLWIKTIDNSAGNLARTFEIKITAVSKNDIKIGLGVEAKTNASVAVTIIDDECATQISSYNAALNNSLDWGYASDVWNETGRALSATGAVSGNNVTISGDLIYYDGFIPGNISLPLTLTPNSVGATRGKATFGTLLLGTATDGYSYRLLEIGEGSYDVCSGTITTHFDLQWDDGGTWSNYYYVRSVYSVH